jgi:hypothetical protein
MNDHLHSLRDKVMFPALLNCSKFTPPEGRPLSWICTQNLDLRPCAAISDVNLRMRESLAALMRCLLDTGFNHSSEMHEGASWYGETVRQHVDARVVTVEKWEQATRDNPLFVLDVPWLKTGKTVQEIADRVFLNHNVCGESPGSAGDLARIIFNYRPRRR